MTFKNFTETFALTFAVYKRGTQEHFQDHLRANTSTLYNRRISQGSRLIFNIRRRSLSDVLNGPVENLGHGESAGSYEGRQWQTRYPSPSVVMEGAVSDIFSFFNLIYFSLIKLDSLGKSSITLRLVRSQWTHEFVTLPPLNSLHLRCSTLNLV